MPISDQERNLLDTKPQWTGLGAIGWVEAQLQNHTGYSHCVLMSSATSALNTALCTIGSVKGRILMSDRQWGGTVAAISSQGYRIHFVSANPSNWCLDVTALPDPPPLDTVAVLSVDWGGFANDLQNLREYCNRFGLILISDSAASLGAYQSNGLPAGSGADLIIHSLGSGKGISCGEGGALLFQDEQYVPGILGYSQHPRRQRRAIGLDCQTFGPQNYRINPFGVNYLATTWHDQWQYLASEQARRFRLYQQWVRKGEVDTVYGLINPLRTTFQQLWLSSVELPIDFMPAWIASGIPEPVANMQSLFPYRHSFIYN